VKCLFFKQVSSHRMRSTLHYTGNVNF
jgi:hypothetical protein